MIEPARLSDGMKVDIAVIGSGPGGAVTAMLCAEAGRSVLMLEEGRHLPLHSAPHFSREELLQKYRTAGVEIAMGRAKIPIVEGCCVGGGSEINRGLYHRIPDYVLEGWCREYGVHTFSPDEMRAHFEACERIVRVEHLPGLAPLLSTRLRDGAQHLGWEAIEAPRLYHYGDGNATGGKQSMTETFVPRFLAAGGKLVPEATVRQIVRRSGRWRLRVRHAPRGHAPRGLEIIANTVFVACGAIQTPALLRRSGIRRNIGNSLRFHPMVKVVALFADEVNRPGDLDPVHQIKQFEPRFSMGCSISNRPMLALAMVNHPSHLDEVDRDWRRMAIYYVQNTGARATVRNLPGFRAPLVRVSQSASDLSELAEGLARLAQVLFAAGAVTIYPCIPGYPVLRSVDDVKRLPASLAPNNSGTTSVHIFASCPMGEKRALSATDSFGRVHDSEGLRIADASLLCGPSVVNPQGTVMAIAHRNACEAIANGFR